MDDAIKRAARKRMAETGEPYTLARRKVIEERARLKDQRSGETEALESASDAGEAT